MVIGFVTGSCHKLLRPIKALNLNKESHHRTFHSICPSSVKKWRYFIEPRPPLLDASSKWEVVLPTGTRAATFMQQDKPFPCIDTRIACRRFRTIFNSCQQFSNRNNLASPGIYFLPLYTVIIACRIWPFFTEHCTRKNTEHWKSTTLTSHQICCASFIMLSNKSLKPCVLSVLFTVKSKTLYKDIIRARSRIN